MREKPNKYPVQLTVNGNQISSILIGRHYLKKHAAYMDDALILQLVSQLDGKHFKVDSSTDEIEYYVADVEMSGAKTYRLIWLFEGSRLEVLGVINAYRRKKRKSDEKI